MAINLRAKMNSTFFILVIWRKIKSGWTRPPLLQSLLFQFWQPEVQNVKKIQGIQIFQSWIQICQSWIQIIQSWIQIIQSWIQIRQSWIQICQSWIQICQSWIQNFNPESRISILNPDMSILNMFEAKTFIFSSLISYFCITRGPRYLELKSAGKKQKHMWGWSRFKLFNIMWGWYTSNKSQSTFIVLKEGFISNRMAILLLMKPSFNTINVDWLIWSVMISYSSIGLTMEVKGSYLTAIESVIWQRWKKMEDYNILNVCTFDFSDAYRVALKKILSCKFI